MTALWLALLLQTTSSVTVVNDVEEVVVRGPAPSSVWCVRYADRRSRVRRQQGLTCRTLAEWDAVRRTRYDSRGYQEQLSLRRFGVGIDSSLMEEAAMGRVRMAAAARRAREGEAASTQP